MNWAGMQAGFIPSTSELRLARHPTPPEDCRALSAPVHSTTDADPSESLRTLPSPSISVRFVSVKAERPTIWNPSRDQVTLGVQPGWERVGPGPGGAWRSTATMTTTTRTWLLSRLAAALGPKSNCYYCDIGSKMSSLKLFRRFVCRTGGKSPSLSSPAMSVWTTLWLPRRPGLFYAAYCAEMDQVSSLFLFVEMALNSSSCPWPSEHKTKSPSQKLVNSMSWCRDWLLFSTTEIVHEVPESTLWGSQNFEQHWMPQTHVFSLGSKKITVVQWQTQDLILMTSALFSGDKFTRDRETNTLISTWVKSGSFPVDSWDESSWEVVAWQLANNGSFSVILRTYTEAFWKSVNAAFSAFFRSSQHSWHKSDPKEKSFLLKFLKPLEDCRKGVVCVVYNERWRDGMHTRKFYLVHLCMKRDHFPLLSWKSWFPCPDRRISLEFPIPRATWKPDWKTSKKDFRNSSSWKQHSAAITQQIGSHICDAFFRGHSLIGVVCDAHSIRIVRKAAMTTEQRKIVHFLNSVIARWISEK